MLKQKRKEKEALAINEYHKNVPGLLTRLNEVNDEETKKLDEALDEVKGKALFYRKLGEAALRPTPQKIAREWDSPAGTVQGTIERDLILIKGAHEKENPFGGALAQVMGVSSGGLVQRKVVHRIEYAGQIRGNAICGDVKRSRDGEPTSMLGEGLTGSCRAHVLEPRPLGNSRNGKSA